eukprot:5027089-Amphidinium_carterae.2
MASATQSSACSGRKQCECTFQRDSRKLTKAPNADGVGATIVARPSQEGPCPDNGLRHTQTRSPAE